MAYIVSYPKSGTPTPTRIPIVVASRKQFIKLPIYDDDYPIIKIRCKTVPILEQEVYIGDGLFNLDTFALYNENNATLGFRYTNSLVATIPRVDWCSFANIEIDYTTGTLTYNGVNYGGTAKTQLHNQICLFGQNATTKLAYMAVADVEIYKNGSLFMHLVPMKDASTGAGYLHDTVSNEDYYSLTSVPFDYSEISTDIEDVAPPTLSLMMSMISPITPSEEPSEELPETPEESEQEDER